MEEIEEDVLHVLEIHNLAKQPVTENDILVWFQGRYPPMDIRKTLAKLETDKRVETQCVTYWSLAK